MIPVTRQKGPCRSTTLATAIVPSLSGFIINPLEILIVRLGWTRLHVVGFVGST